MQKSIKNILQTPGPRGRQRPWCTPSINSEYFTQYAKTYTDLPFLVRLEKTPDKSILDQAGLDAETVREIYDLLAIAKHQDRFVIPGAPSPDQADMRMAQGEKGFE